MHASCKKTHLNWAHLPYRVVWGPSAAAPLFPPGSFTPHSKQLMKDFFSVPFQRKVLAHTVFFFLSFWLIARDDINAPCRLMPGTACWLDVPEVGSDTRLLEMNLSFLHLLSVSQPTFPLLYPTSLHAQCTHGSEQGCMHIRCLMKN